jgi:16S rRNA (guanine527-N7)-methyltransferase
MLAPDQVDEVLPVLHHVLTEIQRRGAIGRVSIDEAIAHAEQYVAALPDDLHGGDLVDLGSGGGLPGLVIIARRPDFRVTLVERRDKRADLLRFGVRGLGATDRAEVVAADAEQVVRRSPAAFDVVSARSFGPLLEVMRLAAQLLRPGGWLIVSEPPDGTPRIDPGEVIALGMVDGGQVRGPAGAVHRWRSRPVD